jgi:DNA polymerase elongation subunit (family B)
LTQIEIHENIIEIKKITQSMIIEFILMGYDLEGIKKFIDNIFDLYYELPNGHITTKIPIDESIEQKKLKEYINNISLKERLVLFRKYINKREECLYIIFRINGFKAIKGLFSEDIEFYNPKFKQHINKEKEE